jgi:hypothetical protein
MHVDFFVKYYKNAIFADILLVFLKSRAFRNELKILHLDRYCIPYFLINVWYALERFRVKRHYNYIICRLLACKCRFTRNLSSAYQTLRRKYGMQYRSRCNIFNSFRNGLLLRKTSKISANKCIFILQRKVLLH